MQAEALPVPRPADALGVARGQTRKLPRELGHDGVPYRQTKSRCSCQEHHGGLLPQWSLPKLLSFTHSRWM